MGEPSEQEDVKEEGCLTPALDLTCGWGGVAGGAARWDWGRCVTAAAVRRWWLGARPPLVGGGRAGAQGAAESNSRGWPCRTSQTPTSAEKGMGERRSSWIRRARGMEEEQ
ncbi:hypothetical protein TRIUR3_33281 [Triticum urartu]|uniref:Uncharacterized protein n=1 Tax=Triticum urartu TaxID=4572 RepID=M7ZC30_TRIUA|nr:hypothetical protein TRIUR3_33281 [Triticum urartu]